MLANLINKKIFIVFFYLLLFFFIFSFNFSLVGDPDFGWHIRYGEEVVDKRNFPTVDQFSHTFSGKGVIETEWLTEVAYYLIFLKGGFWALAFFPALFTSLAFFIPVVFSRGSLPIKFVTAIWAVIGSSLVLAVGARPQNMSLVFFSILFLLLLKFEETKKTIYILLVPFVIFIWANSHPGFLWGIANIVIFLTIDLFFWLFDFFKRKRKAKKIFTYHFKSVIFISIILLLSLFLSTIRPQYQKRLSMSWDGIKGLILPANLAIETTVAGKTRATITEFLPPFFQDVSGTLFLLGIVYSAALFIDRKLTRHDIRNLILLLSAIYFSTLTRRNGPFFFLVFLPITISYTDELFQKLKLKRFSPTLLIFSTIIMLIISFNKTYQNNKNILIKGKSLSTYCEALRYPCQAIEFIKKERLKGNMFNHYNWGAYLVWALPEYPVFMHGRFPDGKVFNDYEKVMQLADGWQNILDKYKVKWMLLPRSTTFEDIVTIDGKWKIIYSDKRSVIFVKND